MNPYLLTSSYGHLGSLALIKQPIFKKENWVHILLVAEGLDKTLINERNLS